MGQLLNKNGKIKHELVFESLLKNVYRTTEQGMVFSQSTTTCPELNNIERLWLYWAAVVMG